MYQEQPFIPPFVQSIAQAMQTPAQARADALRAAAAATATGQERSGQAWGQGITAAGNDVGGALQTAEAPQTKLAGMQVAAAQRSLKMQSTVSGLQKQATNPDGTLNRDMFDKLIQGSGLPLDVQADAGKALDAFEDHKVRMESAQKEGLADLGNLLYYATANLTPDQHDQAVAAVGALASTLPGVQADHIQPYLDAVAKGADPKQLAVSLMALSPSKRYEDLTKPVVLEGARGPDGTPSTLVAPTGGPPIASGLPAEPVAPKPEPNVVFKTPDGVEHPVTVDATGKFLYNGQDVTSAVTRPTQQTPRSLDEQLLDAITKGDKSTADRVTQTMRTAAAAKGDPAAQAATERQIATINAQVEQQRRSQDFTQLQAARADIEKNVNTPYLTARTSANTLRDVVTAAQGGNKVAGSLQSLETTMAAIRAQGLNRINRTETDMAGDAGSLFNNIEGYVGKKLTGQPVPADIQKDMLQFADILENAAYKKYLAGHKASTDLYGVTDKLHPSLTPPQTYTPPPLPDSVTGLLNRKSGG